MRQFILKREESTDQGTPGTFRGDGLALFTLELPWRDNLPRISCIPPGRYVCKPYSSPKYRDVYVLQSVPGRSSILIHSGNWAGDISKGLRSDVQGCILVGLSLGELSGQTAVTSSRAALNNLRNVIGRETFELVISNADEGQE